MYRRDEKTITRFTGETWKKTTTGLTLLFDVRIQHIAHSTVL